jgi:hypothetical protein
MDLVIAAFTIMGMFVGYLIGLLVSSRVGEPGEGGGGEDVTPPVDPTPDDWSRWERELEPIGSAGA